MVPILIWSLVSYVPWIWHPQIFITNPGSVDYLQAGMRMDKEAFANEVVQAKEEKREQEGAILIGKTNLDQFATGLNGTRSPYGIPASTVNPDYIAGGSTQARRSPSRQASCPSRSAPTPLDRGACPLPSTTSSG